MKVTFILKDKAEEFYNGMGGAFKGLLNMVDKEKFDYLNKNRGMHGCSMKIGNGQFREAVELNQMLRTEPSIMFKLESRRGYKLATFTFVKLI